MKRSISLVIMLATALFIAFPLAAQDSAKAVSLGISLGAAFPQGNTVKIPSTDWLPSFNWGFHVNIPLLYTFHLTPSAELYKFDAQNATDIDIAFQFIVPLSPVSLYAGFVPGLTAVGDIITAHVGVQVGGFLRLISNLDLFVQSKYKLLFEGNQNIRVIHVNAGVLFTF